MVCRIPFSNLQVIEKFVIIFLTLFSNSGILEGRFRIGWDCQFEYFNFSGTTHYDNIFDLDDVDKISGGLWKRSFPLSFSDLDQHRS